MLYQRTIAKKVTVTGIGLHSGKKVNLSLYPADADHGIKFLRSDLPGAQILQATATNVGATENATTLGEGINCIHTVEHLLAVFYGLGIDNVYCEIDGPEIPIMDGSGASFVYLIRESGVVNLDKQKKFLILLAPVKVEAGDKWVTIEPCSKLVIDSSIDFNHSKIQKQTEVFEFSCEAFIKDIARARTFGLLSDVDKLKRRGLIRGGSLDNAIVLDEYKVMNPEGLRYSKEFVKHKILDTLGDLALLGHEIAGKVTTYKSGHYLHNLLCRKILETPSCYEIVSASSLQMETRKAFELPLAVNWA